MKVRVRLGVTAFTLVLVGALAGGSFARPYLSPGELAAGASQPVAVAGNSGQATGEGSSTDPDGSAKKGKGWCIGDNDGDTIKCPSHKKTVKKGKGWEIG